MGWAVCASAGAMAREVIDVLNRVRGPFNVSSMRWLLPRRQCAIVPYVDTCRTENATCARGWPMHWPSWACHLMHPGELSFWRALPIEAEAEACDAHLKAAGSAGAPRGRLQPARLPADHCGG